VKATISFWFWCALLDQGQNAQLEVAGAVR